jgi:hypothetical protein
MVRLWRPESSSARAIVSTDCSVTPGNCEISVTKCPGQRDKPVPPPLKAGSSLAPVPLTTASEVLGHFAAAISFC